MQIENPITYLQQLLENKLPEAKIKVGSLRGDLDHLEVIVGSDQFEGKTRLEQHQVIMDIIKEDLKDRLHAVKIATMNLKKYTEKYGE